MRDPARIQPTLAKIAEVWFRHPDMRLGQLLFALTGKDPYYVEDVDLITGAGMRRLMANEVAASCPCGARIKSQCGAQTTADSFAMSADRFRKSTNGKGRDQNPPLGTPEDGIKVYRSYEDYCDD